MSNKSNKTKKFVRCAAVCLTAFATLFSATGCSPKIQDRANSLSDNLLNVCNEQVEIYDADYKMQDFKLLGTDIDKSSFNFDVSFNGISSFSDNSIGYTSVNYTVPSTYFNDVNKTTSFENVYNVFDSIVENLKPESVSVTPVNDLIQVNDAFVKNEPALFTGLNNKRAIVFNIGAPNFDDSTNTIDFNLKTLIEAKAGKFSTGFGLGIGFDGYVGLGYGINLSSAEGTFLTTNNYKLTVDKETYDNMKNNPSLIFDYCVSAINNKDSSKIKAERINTISVAESQAELLDQLNIKNINKELNG